MTKLTPQQWAVYVLHEWAFLFYGITFHFVPDWLKATLRLLSGGDIAFAIIQYVDPDDAIIQSVVEAVEL